MARDSHTIVVGNCHGAEGLFQPLKNNLVISGLTLVTLIMFVV